MRRQLFATILATAVCASPAQAQFAVTVLPSVIGNTIGMMAADAAEAACMGGTPNTDAEIAEARRPAIETMGAYFAAAQAGAGKSQAFHLDRKTRWEAGGVTAGLAELDAAVDPLAVAGNRLQPEPVRFFRSGRDASAEGQWIVRDSAGAVSGLYTGFFLRKGDAWKLRDLKVSSAADQVRPVSQFCHTSGDVLEYRVNDAKYRKTLAEKRLAKAQAKFATADRAAQTSAATAAETPKSSARARQAQTDRAAADLWAKKISEQEEAQRKATADLTLAKSEAQRLGMMSISDLVALSASE